VGRETTQLDLSGKPFGDVQVAIPIGTSNDLTDWLIDEMNMNATGAIAQTLRDANNGNIDQKYGALLAWAGLVKTGGLWDFKPALSQRGLKEVVLGGQVYLDQVVANIHYGYVGRASGFSQIDLLSGAGVAQLKDHHNDGTYGSFLYFFDEPHDRAAIRVGVYLWEHYNGQTITREMLQDALSHFEEFRDYPIPGIPLKINNK
jgi:hypothetical protein